jgi:hypothetical protein
MSVETTVCPPFVQTLLGFLGLRRDFLLRFPIRIISQHPPALELTSPKTLRRQKESERERSYRAKTRAETQGRSWT